MSRDSDSGTSGGMKSVIDKLLRDKRGGGGGGITHTTAGASSSPPMYTSAMSIEEQKRSLLLLLKCMDAADNSNARTAASETTSRNVAFSIVLSYCRDRSIALRVLAVRYVLRHLYSALTTRSTRQQQQQHYHDAEVLEDQVRDIRSSDASPYIQDIVSIASSLASPSSPISMPSASPATCSTAALFRGYQSSSLAAKLETLRQARSVLQYRDVADAEDVVALLNLLDVSARQLSSAALQASAAHSMTCLLASSSLVSPATAEGERDTRDVQRIRERLFSADSEASSWQALRPWGAFLDAGTGVQSLQWALQLNTSSITAITADAAMKGSIERELGADWAVRGGAGRDDRVLVGNWMDEGFCAGLGKYDTILADYLIGAVDGFSPYTQDLIIEKLGQHLKEDGRLYVIGMNPVPDTPAYPACVVSEVRRARDAAILLAGHKPYREFPLEWVERHLARAGLRVLETKRFSILHSEQSVLRQLNVGTSKLAYMDPLVRAGMETYMTDLRERVKKAVNADTETKRIPLSFDYVICATLA